MHNANLLFHDAFKKHSVREIAAMLCVCNGTVQRWIKKDFVPPFYKNDLKRILGESFDVSIEDSDQFYTTPDTAKKCFFYFRQTLKEYNVSTRPYSFVEPSAGCGYFYNLLPKSKRIGIDIDPKPAPNGLDLVKSIIKSDFLKWEAPTGKYIVIGNPPFGRNGKIALDFVLKSFKFADYIGFILPPIFNSTGKGSCHNRLVNMGYSLLKTHDLSGLPFILPNGQEIGVKTIFQVWARVPPHNYSRPTKKSCNEYVDIYNVYVSYKPSRPSSRVHLTEKCDIYIQRSFWGSKPVIVSPHFKDIPYKDAYGIIVKKNKSKIMKFIKNFDWREVAHVSTNGSMSLRKDIIIEQLIKAGYEDVN